MSASRCDCSSSEHRNDDFRSIRQARNLCIGQGFSQEVCGISADEKTDGKEMAMNAANPNKPDITDIEREQLDTTNPEALKEAARLGKDDNYLVKTDLEDADQRGDGDQPDGRPSPMANADNPEAD